ncbi:hypothetical protein D018_0760B, partial [Vibrio parahaemolyticus VP2007-007]
NSDGTYQETYL